MGTAGTSSAVVLPARGDVIRDLSAQKKSHPTGPQTSQLGRATSKIERGNFRLLLAGKQR